VMAWDGESEEGGVRRKVRWEDVSNSGKVEENSASCGHQQWCISGRSGKGRFNSALMRRKRKAGEETRRVGVTVNSSQCETFLRLQQLAVT
jgi:hypothetical protein